MANGNSSSLVSEFDPIFYSQAKKGNLFIYHVASQALLLSATTGGHPTVFNPMGSGKDFIPLALRISFISGTTVIGAVILAETLDAGSAPATASPILTGTYVAPKNAYRGGGAAKTSKMLWYPTTNTFTAAPTAIHATGLNLGAAAPTGTGTYECKFDGGLIFAPGTAMSVCYTVTTSTALFQISILGLERDV